MYQYEFFPVKAFAHIHSRVWHGTFLLHTEQANFLYLAHLGDFSQQFSVLTKFFYTKVKVTRMIKIITYN